MYMRSGEEPDGLRWTSNDLLTPVNARDWIVVGGLAWMCWYLGTLETGWSSAGQHGCADNYKRNWMDLGGPA